MSRRKFNLGDILRKLNEEGEVPGADHSRKLPSPEPPVPRITASDGSTDTTPGKTASSAPSKHELPVQPVIGRKADAFDAAATPAEEFSSGPRPPPADTSGISTPSLRTGRSEHGLKNNDAQRSSPEPVNPPLQPSPPPSPLSTGVQMMGSGDDDDDEEESFDIHRYIGILYRRKYVVLLAVILATLFSLFRYLRSDSYYVATARLLFRPNTQDILEDRMVFRYWGDWEKQFSTHLELLKSRTVLSMVAENIGRDCTPERISGSLTLRQGETDGEKNDIIELTYRDPDPEMARDVLNELCRTYIDYRRDVNAQEITRLVSKFEFQIEKLQGDLSEKENALRNFKETNRMVQLSSETNVTISKLAEMETALQQTQLALLESKERLTALNNQIGRQELNIVQSVTFQDPFQNRIAELELELNTLTSEYSAEHFKVKTLRQQIENLKAATADSVSREAASKTLVKNPIRQTLLQDLVNLTIEKSALEAKRMAQEQIIERLNKELVQLPSLEQRYAFLQRETESLLQTLRMLKSKYEEAKIRRDSEESDLKLLELARLPRAAISTVKQNTVVIGILIGLVLGIAMALLIEYLDQSLKDPSAVEKTLGVPLLGIVPYIEADNALIEQFADLTKNILEPFRALRANLKHIAAANNLQVFIVCSAVKGEGKTTLAANLGITFAVDGKKVILVDADLRRSQTHTLFAIPKETGLADYLMGSATSDDIIKQTRFENMSVVTSGERPHNPAELLGTVRFDHLIAELRTKADIIIFDSPALLPVSDTITMAPKMDGVLFVVRTFWTPLKAAKQALNQLQRIGSRLYGGILNGASHSGKYYPYYYGYYGYYGYYSYKYSYEDDHDRNKPFSIRKAGLFVENAAKEQLNSARYAFPKMAMRLNRGIALLSKRKMFWLLLMLLLGVTMARMAVKTFLPQSLEEPVVYLGLVEGSEHYRQDTDDETGMIATDMAFAHGGDYTPDVPDSTLTERRTMVSDTLLSEKIHTWFDAFLREDVDEYLSYYDPDSFRFDGGRFPQWGERCRRLFAENRDDSVALEDMRIIGKDRLSVEVYVDYTLMMQTDTVAGRIAALWVRSADGWRITRQKALARTPLPKTGGP
ncbi:MAG: polysaccharide biosynthesis tyrosine autokinase [Chitinispirillaceae bacterium]|nr:polysaccharide biosynthesis tyrosine autokinase [Chitinispirillaceae bacterium]